MLYKRVQLPELYKLRHRNDDTKELDYSQSLLDKTLSPFMFYNDNMNGFLKNLQVLLSIYIDKFNIIKNYKNYNTHKYQK